MFVITVIEDRMIQKSEVYPCKDSAMAEAKLLVINKYMDLAPGKLVEDAIEEGFILWDDASGTFQISLNECMFDVYIQDTQNIPGLKVPEVDLTLPSSKRLEALCKQAGVHPTRVEQGDILGWLNVEPALQVCFGTLLTEAVYVSEGREALVNKDIDVDKAFDSGSLSLEDLRDLGEAFMLRPDDDSSSIFEDVIGQDFMAQLVLECSAGDSE